MDLERETQRAGFRQDLARLRKVKGFILTKDIHKWQRRSRGMSFPPLFEHWDHCLTNKIGVALRVIFVFGRDGMRTEEGNGKVEWSFIIKGKQSFEQTQLGRGLQTIARFGFDGR